MNEIHNSMHDSTIFCDTNVLLNDNFDPSIYKEINISIISIEELDHLKCDERKGYQARNAIRKIKSADNAKIIFDIKNTKPIPYLEYKNDNIILKMALESYQDNNNLIFISDDYGLIIKAEGLGLPCKMFEFEKNDLEIYKGYKDIILDEEQLAEYYQSPINKWDLLDNQYLIIKNCKNEVIDKQKWTIDNRFKPLSYKTIDTTYAGKIKPRNIQQELAFDLIQNKSITIKCLYGCFGSGKDAIMSAHALNFIQKGMYDKIIFVRNNIDVKNTKPVGYLKGELDSKLLPYAMPLADHVGGVDGLNLLINQNKIELQHMGFIRGRDIKNSIIYCSEAENLTKEHIQLLISRLAEGSTLWLNGDFKQIDDVIFERNNGLKQTINSLKGEKLFGCVEFSITERSESARLAELLD